MKTYFFIVTWAGSAYHTCLDSISNIMRTDYIVCVFEISPFRNRYPAYPDHPLYFCNKLFCRSRQNKSACLHYKCLIRYKFNIIIYMRRYNNDLISRHLGNHISKRSSFFGIKPGCRLVHDKDLRII